MKLELPEKSTKRSTLYAAMASLFAVLLYLQIRAWHRFDWPTFWRQTDQVNKVQVVAAIALNFFAYGIRAFRWKILLTPLRKDTATRALLAPTLIGFTGLAMLGRPGELIRPYLIARRQSLSLPSQLAIWTVERVLDLSAFALLLLAALFLAPATRELAYYGSLRSAAVVVAIVVGSLALIIALMSYQGESVTDWLEYQPFGIAKNLVVQLRKFHNTIRTVHHVSSFALLTLISLLMWLTIALAYHQITHAYTIDVLQLPLSKVLVLMSFSMLGSLIQLPGVGGGAQLATIAGLEYVFLVPHEIAASCGILLWLVTMISVVPIGLLLARYEQYSFRQLADATSNVPMLSSTTPEQAGTARQH